MWCGPVAVAAIIGVDVAAVRDLVKWHRNGKAVKGTHSNELCVPTFRLRHAMRCRFALQPANLRRLGARAHGYGCGLHGVGHSSLGSGARQVALRYLHQGRAAQDQGGAPSAEAGSISLPDHDRCRDPSSSIRRTSTSRWRTRSPTAQNDQRADLAVAPRARYSASDFAGGMR
jgi:hypothetical protein